MNKPIVVQDAIFAFTSGLTYQEYLRTVDQTYRTFLDRRYWTIRMDAESQLFLTSFSNWCYFVLLVNEDTPDGPLIAPLIQRIAELCPRIELRFVHEETDLSGLNDLVDDDVDLNEDLDELDLPQLFIFDEEWNQQAQWGPRPELAEDRLEKWLNDHPQYELLFNDDDEEEPGQYERLMVDLTHQMRLWYNDDLTDATIREVLELLKQLDDDGNS